MWYNLGKLKKETVMKNIILDADLYNEIDDQIALAYVLKSMEISCPTIR